MRTLRHPTGLLTAVVLLSSLGGCVKEISSEERLERESPKALTEPAPSAEQLARIDCSKTEGLAQARNVNRPESDRLIDYANLYASLRKKVRAFEEAMSRNPDLLYREDSARLAGAKEGCIQQAADVRLEFSRYVRELVDVPTVQEVKGGSAVTVARIDFDLLRQAIEVLDPDDKEQLLNRVGTVEDRLQAAGQARPKAKKRGAR